MSHRRVWSLGVGKIGITMAPQIQKEHRMRAPDARCMDANMPRLVLYNWSK